MMSTCFLLSSLGFYIILKLFDITNYIKVKWIVYGSQLGFHYIYVSLIVFIWFNFQMCDIVHDKTTNLEKEEKILSSNHFHSIYHLPQFIGDCMEWFLKFRKEPFIELTIIVFLLLTFWYAMENFITEPAFQLHAF